MISIPFLTQLFDAKAVIMASTMTCVLNLFIAVKNWRHVDLKRLFRILFYMCIGLPIGVYGLKTLDVDALKHLLGGFMLVIGGYGIMKLWIPRAAGMHLPAWALRGCLIAGGDCPGCHILRRKPDTFICAAGTGGEKQIQGHHGAFVDNCQPDYGAPVYADGNPEPGIPPSVCRGRASCAIRYLCGRAALQASGPACICLCNQYTDHVRGNDFPVQVTGVRFRQEGSLLNPGIFP